MQMPAITKLKFKQTLVPFMIEIEIRRIVIKKINLSHFSSWKKTRFLQNALHHAAIYIDLEFF